MKILFTGASSFTGYWFAKSLAIAGHNVTVIFTKNNPDDYEGHRKIRINDLLNYCTPAFNCRFGDDKFISLIRSNKYELLCHHAAEVNNYKSAGFDFNGALKNNTNNIQSVFQNINSDVFAGTILTGSVFEQNEGTGSLPLRAFSPYGLSKGLTSKVFEYYSDIAKTKLGKFVIPNPFGPFEEQRFTYYLIKNWFDKNTPVVSAPNYIRDNIHIDLLAAVYAYFTNVFINTNEMRLKINPSGYAQNQGAFTARMSKEFSERLNIECGFILQQQTDFSEPMERINTDNAERLIKNYNESNSWDIFAGYYLNIFKNI